MRVKVCGGSQSEVLVIQINKLSPTIGAEVIGLDLTNLSQDNWRLIDEAFAEHQMLVFRGQDLEPEKQLAFARRFGELHLHPAAPSLEQFPEIMLIHADENSKHVAGNAWHTDVSCDEEPPSITMLYMMELPPIGGDTLFASMYAAYETLSDELKERIAPLRALHSSDHIYTGRYNVGANDSRAGTYPKAYHPMVTTHPVTGRKALFVNQAFTTAIEGMDDDEAQPLLNRLFSHQQKPEFQCRLKWDVGSLAMWDDRCTQHYAIWDYFPQRRHGHRVTVAGTVPS